MPPRAVAAAALLVILAGSVVGTAEVVASAMVDYHLQSEQIVATSKVHVHTHVHAAGAAGSECISCVQQQLSLAADATGARDAGRILLGANVVIVAWVTAMRGGRLGTTTPGRPPVAVLHGPAQKFRIDLAHVDGRNWEFVIGHRPVQLYCLGPEQVIGRGTPGKPQCTDPDSRADQERAAAEMLRPLSKRSGSAATSVLTILRHVCSRPVFHAR